MNFSKTFLTGFLIIAALAAFTGAALAQKSDQTVVTGEHSLKQSDINRLTEFYEWLLDRKFTPEQRRRYQTLVIERARENPQTAKVIIEIVQGFEQIRADDEAKREQARRQILPEIVAAIESEGGEINNLLLEVYRGAPNTADKTDSPADAAGMNDSGGATRVADLAGIWSTSSVSGERYKSLVTGELSDPSGTIIEYEISPNGTIKHVGYLSMTTYSCTTKLFISRTGRISISGSNITFDFAPGKRMYQTCSKSASRNDTLPAERKTYPFRLERDEYGVKLCYVEDGKDFCIRRKGD